MKVPRQAYNVREFAATFGISVPSVKNYIASGTLPVIRMGGRVLIAATVVDEIVRGERIIDPTPQGVGTNKARR